MKTTYLVSALLAIGAQGQVVFRESELRNRYLHEINRLPEVAQNYPTYSLPPYISNEELAAEAESQNKAENGEDVKSGFFQFGHPFQVSLGLDDGAWMEMTDGKATVWRLAIESKAALSLNLLFDEFHLSGDSELYVSSLDANKQVVETVGPFTEQNNKPSRQFAIAPMAGNALLIELYDTSRSNKPTINIRSVVHGFRETPYTHPVSTLSSGRCNINVACPDGNDWRKEIRSVVMMLTRSGSGFCSGSMLNNLKQDGRQLFLTANHCTGGDVSDDMVMFNFEASACNGNGVGNRKQTAQGLKTLAKYYDSDFAIFEVEEKVPESYNVFLAGWSALPAPFVPSNPVGIHHPSVDIKKISFAFLNASQSCWSGCRGLPDHWKIDKWSKGTTEPGSSGSPLFDGITHRVVGQLHGGSASCYNSNGYDAYGKLTSSWDHGLAAVLDPAKTGVRAQDGVELTKARQRSFSRFVVQ